MSLCRCWHFSYEDNWGENFLFFFAHYLRKLANFFNRWLEFLAKLLSVLVFQFWIMKNDVDIKGVQGWWRKLASNDKIRRDGENPCSFDFFANLKGTDLKFSREFFKYEFWYNFSKIK